MNFIKKVSSSIYDPVFYKDIPNKSLGFSLKYFFSLIVILSLIFSGISLFQVVPKFGEFVNYIKENGALYYPAELEVTIKNGLVSTNVSEPYVIKIPEDKNREFVQNNKELENIENFLVINTQKDFSLDDFRSYKTIILITKDSWVTLDKGKITINPIGKFLDVVVNREKVSSWIDKIIPYLNHIKTLLPVLIFIGHFLVYSGLLVYFLLAGFLVFLIGKLKKLDLSYGASYKISIHAATLSILLSALTEKIFHLQRFPLLFTVVLLIMVMLNFRRESSPLIS